MKPNKVSILILVIVCAIAQSTLFERISIAGVKPDLLLLIVFFFGFYLNRSDALVAGLLCGFFTEICSGINAGVCLVTYAASGFVLAHFAKMIYSQRPLGQIAVVSACTLVVYLALYTILHFFFTAPPLLTSIKYIVLPSCIYTACIAPIVFNSLKLIWNV